MKIDIFGEIINNLTHRTAEFILSHTIPSDIEDFHTVFRGLKPLPRKLNVNLNRFGNLMHIWDCTLYSTIVWTKSWILLILIIKFRKNILNFSLYN